MSGCYIKETLMSTILLVATKGITPTFTADNVARYLSFDKAIDVTKLDGDIEADPIDLGIPGIETMAFRYGAEQPVTPNVTLVLAGQGVTRLDPVFLSPVVTEVMRRLQFVPGVHDYSMFIQKSYVVYVFRKVSLTV